MAKKKAELESDFQEYASLQVQVREAIERGDFQVALQKAVASFEYIDGKMQFARRYKDQTSFKTIDTLDVVLRYAPLLFDTDSLDRVEDLLRNQKRIEKNTASNLADQLSSARNRMWEGYHLWRHLDKNGEIQSGKLSRRREWKKIVDDWVRIGYVTRSSSEPGTFVFTTDLDERIPAKCSSCGAQGTGSKAKLIEKLTCPRCKNEVYFVWLAPQTA